VGQRRDFKFGTQVGRSYFQHTDYKPSLKGAWLRYVIEFGGPIHISGMAEARAVKFCTKVGYIESYQNNKKSPLKGATLWSRDLFKFLVPLQYLRNG